MRRESWYVYAAQNILPAAILEVRTGLRDRMWALVFSERSLIGRLDRYLVFEGS
jgi:hypothetical protein